MSTFESPYKSLLQGVSQQLPEERLPGQVTSQTNMVSDPVTNLRRRPGVVMRKAWGWVGADAEHVLSWFTDLGGARVHILLNTRTGNIRMLDENFVEVANLAGGEYLTTTDNRSIRAAAVGTEFFIANTAIKPAITPGTNGADPANSGFFYVTAGAFGRAYTATVTWADGELTASYTTPGGTGAGDAAMATPEYIATQLAAQLSGTTLTQIRLTGFNFQLYDAGGRPATPPAGYTATLQVNTGTAFAPVWTNVTFPYTNTPDFFSRGNLRVRSFWPHTDVWDLITSRQFTLQTSVQFEASTVSGFIPGIARSATVSVTDLWGSSGVQTAMYGVADFTSAVTLPAGPVLIIQREGPYVFISRSGAISVNTSVGSQYMLASRGGNLRSTGDLPAKLPPAADGYLLRVGTGPASVFYRFNYNTSEWLEDSAYLSPVSIGRCPVSVMRDKAGRWVVNFQSFEGRRAGDDETNATHAFIRDGITGMATYQGRLVLMSGPMVSLSAAGHPRRFYRSTVTNVVASDTIEIGSGMNSAAAYEWAVQFNKDLLLFSRAYQALIPSGNTAISPTNAAVVPTSSHETDTTSGPITAGRTLMYCNPRSEDFFGVLEMLPSNYTDSQYTSQDSTPHLPKYMGGRCRFAVSSGVASLALFAPSGDTRSLIVHEYHWDGDTKVQQSWHQWTFEYPVASAYFAGDMIVLAFVRNGMIVLGTIDPRAGALNAQSERRPFLDLNVTAEIVDHVITVPAWMLTFDPAMVAKLKPVVLSGSLAGEYVGATPQPGGATLRTALSWPSGGVGLGLPYYSGVTPGPPVVTDYANEVIHSGKATLLRYLLGTRNSSEFKVSVSDDFSMAEHMDAPTITWASPELELGVAPFSKKASVIVPCRTELRSTAMEVFTTGTGELNITSLEYVGKHHAKIKRK